MHHAKTSANNTSELKPTQTVTLSGTNVTVKGVSDKFKVVGDKVTSKAYTASNILVQTSQLLLRSRQNFNL